ncbi:sensor histidine kinase [Ulvibacterium sp.]|uniref:sensor histidine kinase n=1 Tax=Ulvibacterium sp. TaxID=2665914 RepID=UPI003BAC6FA1
MKKYKRVIVHSFVWIIFILLINHETLDLEWGVFDRKDGSLIIPLFYGTALGALIFYLNIYSFIPQFFGKGDKKRYWLLASATLLGVSILEAIFDIIYVVSQNYELAKMQIMQGSKGLLFEWLFMIFASSIIPNASCWILSFAYRLPKDWLLSEKQKGQLEKDKLRSELDFLKAQINPHFLFNGINSIYHLIGEDNTLAKNTLLQFSGLLRYQLYDCSVNYISLEKELGYLKNYITIEKVRKGEDAIFTFTIPKIEENPDVRKYKIAPLLISPFLENAFKYLSHHSDKEKNHITLELAIQENGFLNMKLSNTFDDTFKIKKDSTGGIGLENVKRRLNLLYPNEKHRLQITSQKNRFLVDLKLDLNED